MCDSDDEQPPQLSAATLAALQEFYAEQEERKVQAESNNSSSSQDLLPTFQENWQLSQFWYDNHTSETLAAEIMSTGGDEGKIALVSCPTLYNHVRTLSKTVHVTLFEFDERFASIGEDYCFYDYRKPLELPRTMAGSYDLVVADPPFLSEECLTKTAVTIKYLAKQKILLCTGSTMADLARRLLQVEKTSFVPRHTNNLANEFACYVNYPTKLTELS